MGELTLENGERRAANVLAVTHGGFIMEFNNVVERIHKQMEKFDNSAKNCSISEYLITYPIAQKGGYEENLVNV
jgi:broad specificity phosphatase PhoE